MKKESVRLRALERAHRYIGVQEDPPGSNNGRLIRGWLHEAGVPAPNPYCAAFDYSMKQREGSRAVSKISHPAAVASWVEAADRHGWRVQRPLRGDDVAYSWHGHTPHPDDHIGIVDRVLALPRLRRNGMSWKYWIRTVEGNTLGGVHPRWRWVDPRDVAFIRIPD